MFDSPQVKEDLISIKINFVYELSHEFANIIRFKILGNWEIPGKPRRPLEGEHSGKSPFQT